MNTSPSLAVPQKSLECMLLPTVRAAKRVLCYSVVVVLYSATLLILPAKAEHCLFPKSTNRAADAGNRSSVDLRPVPRGVYHPVMLPRAEINDWQQLKSPPRSILVPGCNPTPSFSSGVSVLGASMINQAAVPTDDPDNLPFYCITVEESNPRALLDITNSTQRSLKAKSESE